jgi:hypothetical protein
MQRTYHFVNISREQQIAAKTNFCTTHFTKNNTADKTKYRTTYFTNFAPTLNNKVFVKRLQLWPHRQKN